MTQYKITHTTRYSYTEPVPVCHNQVHLAPRDTPWQKCKYHRLLIHPSPAERGKRVDYFGNLVDFFTIQKTHHGLTVTANSRVEVREPNGDGAQAGSPWEVVARSLREGRGGGLEHARFLFASPHVITAPWLAEYARSSFPPDRPLLEAVDDLTARIHADFRYDPQVTTVHTPLDEVFRLRSGVCQDFAHLGIGCLRSLGLAARYVSGYLRTLPPPGRPRLVGVDASHAWLSVYAGDQGWVDFDPTNNARTGADHITVAWGRDYLDVCPIQGVFVGGGQHSMTVEVDVLEEGN